MRDFLFTIVIVLSFASIAAQQSDEAYPGQRLHQEPPAGWFCEPPALPLHDPPDHPCSCSRMAMSDPSGQCAHDPDGKEHVLEDPKCAVFCHMDHCKCLVHSCDT